MSDEEREPPFQVTHGSELYDSIRPLPVSILLEDLRSAYNVGSFFRTADAVRADKLLLCGISSAPPHSGVLKTALGAENTVRWEHHEDPGMALRAEADRGCELAAIETGVRSVDLFDWVPRFPVCLVFGNEKSGLSPAVSEACDTFVRIPMLGFKHSLNVATAGGVVLYELLRKYRALTQDRSWPMPSRSL
ncbi:MAG TPA: RNA methyltransferase [Bryobacteraceae bacterium]|nr:RNA methyltransferase [Bryobacteraceae bacterium]